MSSGLSWSGQLPRELASRKRRVFIVAPRVVTEQRLKELVKKYLPHGEVVLGIAEEDYVTGFEGQPQFAMLRIQTVQRLVERVNQNSPVKIFILGYPQAALVDVVTALRAKQYVFIRGSWKYMLHTRPVFEVLRAMKRRPVYESPFSTDDEARAYAEGTNVIALTEPDALHSRKDFAAATDIVAKSSYDHSFQTGAILAKKDGRKYSFVAAAHNQVVPYETYAMHHGFSREQHKSPPQDLNHYDTVHAETMLLLKTMPEQTQGAALFTNLAPCRTCARAIVAAGINEVYFAHNHSVEYTKKLFADAGMLMQKVDMNHDS